MLKRTPRTRLSLLRPEADSDLTEARSQQYDTASGRVRQLEPGMTVSVANPRQDSRGKWLCGVIIQRLGPATYLVSVEGRTRYVYIDQLGERDGRSFPKYTWEPTGEISVSPVNKDNDNNKQKGQDQSTSARENITETPMAQQLHQTPTSTTVPEERQYPLRENRKPPKRYRQS